LLDSLKEGSGGKGDINSYVTKRTGIRPTKIGEPIQNRARGGAGEEGRFPLNHGQKDPKVEIVEGGEQAGLKPNSWERGFHPPVGKKGLPEGWGGGG